MVLVPNAMLRAASANATISTKFQKLNISIRKDKQQIEGRRKLRNLYQINKILNLWKNITPC